ncbi:MAG: hypothetical protein EOO73_03695 [Myxococcales bacterium]|nr:MAG: hypothetical protein EOO73_03695 [Myxococcales bacterium]
MAHRPLCGVDFGHLDITERLISELSRVLTRRGLSVRSEPLWGVHAGGKCRLKGKDVVLLNTKAPPMERLVMLADYVAEQRVVGDELSVEAHALLQSRIARRSDVLSPADASRPGLAKGGARAPRKQRRV